jgi:hypothetical protein
MSRRVARFFSKKSSNPIATAILTIAIIRSMMCAGQCFLANISNSLSFSHLSENFFMELEALKSFASLYEFKLALNWGESLSTRSDSMGCCCCAYSYIFSCATLRPTVPGPLVLLFTDDHSSVLYDCVYITKGHFLKIYHLVVQQYTHLA